tara:strand:- start:2051 stop:2566 length:516 start_codon:yes stop_codon:yes gene_type:complete
MKIRRPGATQGRKKEKQMPRASSKNESHRQKRLPPGVSNPVDIHVGQRLRLRRTLLGMSQEKLGDAVGLTFQQIQKYERGANRIGASRLYMFSRILDVPVAYFFEELPSQIRTHEGQMQIGLSDLPQDALERDPMARRETLELVRAYYAVGNPKVRRRIVDLVRSLGGEED